MSWNKCKHFGFLPRSTFTSDLFKVLLALKLLQSNRGGGKGSTLEDVAMYMMKHFSLDGDIKSQVLAALKYGVKMNFIQRKKEKFSLIMPASSIQIAPCKFKMEEIGRIDCIFPPKWESNTCDDGICGGSEKSTSCCGQRKRKVPMVCGQEIDQQEVHQVKKRVRESKSREVCGKCYPCPKKKRKKSEATYSRECLLPPSGYRDKRKPCPQPFDDMTTSCIDNGDDDDDKYGSSTHSHNAYRNCTCCSNK